MMKIKNCFFKSIFFLVVVISVRCNDNEFQSNFHIFEQIRTNFFVNSDFTMTNTILEIMVHNWSENYQCLNELNAIKNGIFNTDEWAVARKFFLLLAIELNVECSQGSI